MTNSAQVKTWTNCLQSQTNICIIELFLSPLRLDIGQLEWEAYFVNESRINVDAIEFFLHKLIPIQF